MKVMISAGESSGDKLGAGLAEALRRRDPSIEFVGMGGPRMEAAGVRRVQDAAEISVVGFSEVVPRLPQIRRAMKRLVTVLADERPDLLVPIDFPNFNLRLSTHARKHDVGVVYFDNGNKASGREGNVTFLLSVSIKINDINVISIQIGAEIIQQIVVRHTVDVDRRRIQPCKLVAFRVGRHE